jgi:hypothetical protein
VPAVAAHPVPRSEFRAAHSDGLQLGLRLHIPACNCLSRLDSLCDDFNVPEERVIDWADVGLVPMVFNIAVSRVGRRELRVWKPVRDALRESGGKVGPVPDLKEVLRQLVPERGVRSSELEVLWRCSHQHVHELIDAGALPVARRATAKAGPLSCHYLAADAVRAFLKERVIEV